MTADTGDQHQDIPEVIEPEGINAMAIAWTVIGGLVILLSGVFFVMEFSILEFQEAKTEATTSTGYPTLAETNAEAAQMLSNYEVIDFEASIYRIPIDRAMELIVEEAGNTDETDQTEITQ
jgi:hypothetical protein